MFLLGTVVCCRSRQSKERKLADIKTEIYMINVLPKVTRQLILKRRAQSRGSFMNNADAHGFVLLWSDLHDPTG